VQASLLLVCQTCNAEYTSQKQFSIHTKKQSCSPATSLIKGTREPTFSEMIQSAETEDDIQAIIDAKIASAPRLDPDTHCLFCPHESKDLDMNLAHMSQSHSFFIPDLEYLVDARGLVEYLGHKISVSNMCLHCNGVGKAFYSLDAVRKHMQEKGHGKMEYLENEDEYLDFYDYSLGVDVVDDEESWDDVEMESTSDGPMRRSDLGYKRYVIFLILVSRRILDSSSLMARSLDTDPYCISGVKRSSTQKSATLFLLIAWSCRTHEVVDCCSGKRRRRIVLSCGKRRCRDARQRDRRRISMPGSDTRQTSCRLIIGSRILCRGSCMINFRFSFSLSIFYFYFVR
jgi:hypothetical protein